MTNWEKFMEVFGIPADSKIKAHGDICEIVNCIEVEECCECPLYKFGWGKEYKESKEE